MSQSPDLNEIKMLWKDLSMTDQAYMNVLWLLYVSNITWVCAEYSLMPWSSNLRKQSKNFNSQKHYKYTTYYEV